MTRLYLSGPMSGIPDFNFPAFNAEAARLRALGWTVENPAENPKVEGDRWELYMRQAITQMMLCDVIALLPGWGASRGANVEVYLARQLGMLITDASSIRTGGALWCRRCEKLRHVTRDGEACAVCRLVL